MKPARWLSASELAQWRDIPAAVVSDEREHHGVMAWIRPLFARRAFAGQAFTIEVASARDVAPRSALAHVWAGACIVIDARAAPDAAVWGGNLMRIARERGVAAVVVDGNVRDTSELRDSGVSVCSRGVTPRGPAWGGRFDVPIECGGATISPGDLVIGDDDGVIAVPLEAANDALLARCRARLAREAQESLR
ncbi:MAG TPA: RraA family protein [Casimicrobiaceae bacterium]|nr:RraA family protein [Casimicrobiaceae bacterium]